MTDSTILIVDDTESNIDILIGLLKDYDVLVALDGQTAIEIAQQERIDLILLDIVMPEMDGFETCRQLKTIDNCKNIPIIFITAKTDEESIEQAYELGGLDYVTKPFKPRELLARVKTQLSLKYLIADLERLSNYDTMTGVYNRRKFFEDGAYICQQYKQNLFAVMLDIDKFKAINDNYGHPTGDLVIQQVASIASELIPSDGMIGRLGGEEFAILLWQASKDDALTVTESIRKKIEQHLFLADSNEPFQVTVSSGIAQNEETNDLETLLKHADEALYQAKGTGRNKSIFRG